MTRAEQIRQMDDKELADWICKIQPDCEKCKFLQHGRCMVMIYVQEEAENEPSNRRK